MQNKELLFDRQFIVLIQAVIVIKGDMKHNVTPLFSAIWSLKRYNV